MISIIISISITAIKDILNSAAAAKVLRGRCHILCRARFLPTDKLLWIAVVEAKTKQEDASQAMRLFWPFSLRRAHIWWWGCGDDGGGVDGGHGQGRHEVHKDQFKMIMVKGLLYEANSAWSREIKTWVGAVVLSGSKIAHFALEPHFHHLARKLLLQIFPSVFSVCLKFLQLVFAYCPSPCVSIALLSQPCNCPDIWQGPNDALANLALLPTWRYILIH